MTTRPKAVIESRDGEELSPITITKNVLTDDGQNLHDILSDRKEDMMTPTIENSSSMFKVGQGDNVDYSENVVDGAYESMVLKGKSMVNCIKEPSSQDVVLPYEFEDGQYVTINDTKESGALGVELKGQTLVNLISINRVSITSGSSHEYPYNIIPTIGKKYLIKVKIKSVGESTNSLPVKIQPFNSGTAAGYFNITSNDYFVGNEITKIITCIDGDNIKNGKFTIWCRDLSSGTFECDIVMFEYQEGMENWDIPYIEGMASCKMPILHTVGKNLFDINGYSTKNQYASINGNTITVNAPTTFSNTVYALTGLKEGELYRVSLDKTGAGEFSIRDTNASSLLYVEKEEGHVSRTFTYKKGATIRIGNRQIVNSEVSFTNIQIEHGSTETAHESYKSSILSLPEEVVLCSLPSGICDTFNTKTGVYTQRIGEYVLDGSQSVTRFEEISGASYCNSRFVVNGFATTNNPLNTDIYCDKFSTGSVSEEAVRETIKVYNQGGYVEIRLSILKSKLSSVNASGVVQYLQSNPTTIQYELKTPIITKIPLSSTLKSWNATTHIYSEILENTLYPTLTHSNPSYPVILKPSTKYSIVANSYSNNHTNSTINFNLGGATTSTTVGNRVTTITTPSTLSNELLTMSGRGNKLSHVMVVEGDVVGDEQYFEGICDCKSPILSNIGENLLDIKNAARRGSHRCNFINHIDGSITLVGDGDGSGEGMVTTSCHAYLKEGRTYIFSFESDGQYSAVNGTDTVEAFLLRDGSASDYIIHMQGYVTTFTCGRSGNYYLRFDVNKNNTTHKFWNVYLAEVSTDNSYEPHKSNTTTFDQKDGKTIVLRSLPNGVCDTLNVETGECVQRIGEKTFSGANNEGWTIANNGIKANTIAFGYSGLNGATRSTNVLCDTFIYPVDYTKDREGIQTQSGNQGQIYISIFTSKLSTPDAAGFKAWLQANPVTVQYELATPIISTIDIQGFPYAYANGYILLSSGSIEQSLTPKVEYSVITNRNGQIRSNQKMVERQQKQLDRLQAMVLANLVNTQYEQTLTNLKYDLKNVREEVK